MATDLPPTNSMSNELTRLRIDKSRKKPRRGWGGKLLLLLLLLGAAGGAWAYYQKVNAGIPVKVVRAEVVQSGAQNSGGTAVLTASGYVIPRQVVDVSSKIIGRVKEMNVVRGQEVREAEIMIRLEDDEQQAQLRMAESRLGAANARLAEMRAGSRPQEVQAARAAVASAEATMANSKSDLDRKERLAGDQIISAQELDAARTAYKVAQASLNSARENLKLIETWPRREMLDAAIADQKEAQANVAFAQTQLDNTVIRAPIAGTILEKVAEKGELVTNANYGGTRGPQSSVVSMADLKDLQVELDINEADLPRVRMHQAADVKVDSAPDKLLKGEVDEIAPQADRQKGTVQVKVRLIEPSREVLPEVNARVTFLEPASEQKTTTATEMKARVFAPKAAVVGEGIEAKVFIAAMVTANGKSGSATGKAVERKVKIGSELPRGIEILEGLAGNEMLIAEPLSEIKDGDRIVVQTSAPTTQEGKP